MSLRYLLNLNQKKQSNSNNNNNWKTCNNNKIISKHLNKINKRN